MIAIEKLIIVNLLLAFLIIVMIVYMTYQINLVRTIASNMIRLDTCMQYCDEMWAEKIDSVCWDMCKGWCNETGS